MTVLLRLTVITKITTTKCFEKKEESEIQLFRRLARTDLSENRHYV